MGMVLLKTNDRDSGKRAFHVCVCLSDVHASA